MKNIIEANYQSIKKRGLITENTTEYDFVMKLEEEVQEFIDAESSLEIAEELADVILVCLNYAKHYRIDIEKQLLLNITKNQTRHD